MNIDCDWPDATPDIDYHFDITSGRTGKQIAELRKILPQADDDRVQSLTAREGEQLASEIFAACRGDFDRFHRAQVFWITEPAFEYLRVAAYNHQHIIEVVRYAAGQLSQCLHLLRLRELLLCAPQFCPRFMALGDVAHDICEPDEFTVLVAYSGDHHGRQKQRSILPNAPAVMFVGSRGRGRRESTFGSTV